jgi:hypothetical protein
MDALTTSLGFPDVVITVSSGGPILVFSLLY